MGVLASIKTKKAEIDKQLNPGRHVNPAAKPVSIDPSKVRHVDSAAPIDRSGLAALRRRRRPKMAPRPLLKY